MLSHIGMHNEIFHFEIFKNLMEILKYFKTPSLKYEIFYFHYEVT